MLPEMLDGFYSACVAVAKGVETITGAGKYIVNLNYELVASVIEGASHCISSIIYVYFQIKLFFVTITSYIMAFIQEIYSSFISILTTLWKVITLIINFTQACYINISEVCLTFVYYISSAFLFVKHTVLDVHGCLTASVHFSFNVVASVMTTLFVIVSTIGTYCVDFVTGVWQGLGFVLSSVAYFPVYCVQCVEDGWKKCIETIAKVFTATTKETYLGIVVVCLVYLTLSNALQYLHCRGLSLFPRFRSRRMRTNNPQWQFDRGFESDFEDMYNSDTEDRLWVGNRNDDNDDTDAADEDDNDNDSYNSDDVSDNDSDSDEYTVVTEESDSDASINSQTFSTESSDHEIEVQLPSLEERYSLRNRSSTPSRMPKAMNSPEEFDREMERERDKRKCVVCQDQIKSVLVLPCRHMCMCVLCADQIVRLRTVGRRVCPLCRTRITKVMNIYV